METLKTHDIIYIPNLETIQGQRGERKTQMETPRSGIDLDFNSSKQGLWGRKENMLKDSQQSTGSPAA